MSAVQKNPVTYEHIPPETIGNQRQIVISDQSGVSNIIHYAAKFGIKLTKADPLTRTVLARLKELENQGYQFEAAEASFELMMRSLMKQRPAFFELQGLQVHCDLAARNNEPNSSAIATVKVTVEGQNLLEIAEENGAVSALDKALRKALTRFYPEIAGFRLTDYKVRILDGTKGTSAPIRVLAESSDGSQSWTTIGVSSNILDASYQAVVEGIEYGLLQKKFLATKISSTAQ